MQLKFNKITINNFMSFQHEELQLSNMGYSIVSGVNHKKIDNSQSNGSGKSTIFNAVCYALTGETAQGLKNNIENIYADPNDCWVELDFNVDNDNFVIRRIKTPATNMKIFINGVDMSGKGIKESTKVLSDYLPDLTSMLVGSIIILGQGLPYRFADNHPGGRKEVLEKLTKSDYLIQSIREKLDLRQVELKQQLRTHEDSLVSSTTQLNLYTNQLNDYTNELKEYEEYSSSEDSLDKKLTLIKQGVNKCLGLTGTLGVQKTNLDNDLKKIDDEKTKHLLSKDKQLMSQIIEDIDRTIETNKGFSITNQVKIKTLESEIKRLDSITDICPTCGQKIPNVKKIDTSDLKKELENEKEMLSLHEDKIKDLNGRRDVELKELTKKFNEKLDELTAKYNTVSSELSKINTDINNNNTEYQSLLREELKFKNLKENYDKLISNIKSVNEQITETNKVVEELNKNIVEDNDHLSVIQNLITLTKREFRGVLLENVITYMNNKVKQYSQQVFNNDLLSFTLNDNYIDIMFDGRYYESMSGGEKQKVDIIIQLALRDLLSTHLNLHSNILVVDEVFDNLDTTGCQRVLDLISNLNDVESVFIISHHASELQISYDTEITVDKNDQGISSISIH